MKRKSSFSVIIATASIASINILSICQSSFAANLHEIVNLELAGRPLIIAGLSAEEYFDRGNAKQKSQDYQGAIADYTQAISLNGVYADAYFNRGVAKGKLQDYQGAIIDYTQVILLDSTEASAYNNRGNDKQKLQDYQGAITDFQRAIALNPKQPMYADNLRKAKNAADRANAPTTNPSSTPQKTARYYEQQSSAKFEVKDYRGAITEFDRAIEVDPQYAEAYYGRGTAKYVLKQNDNALPDLEQAAKLYLQQGNSGKHLTITISIKKIKGEIYAAKGTDKFKAKDYQGAITEFDRAIEFNTELATAFHGRGTAKYLLKQNENALRDLERAANLYRQANNNEKYEEVMTSIKLIKGDR